MQICKLTIQVKESMKGVGILLICSLIVTLSNVGGDFNPVKPCVIAIMVVFYICATLTICMGRYMSSLLGLGKETKSKIFWRQVGLILAFTICNVYPLVAMISHVACQDDVCFIVE